MHRCSRFLLLFFALALCGGVHAQSVQWKSDGNPSELALVFSNCQPDGDPRVPAINGVRLNVISRSESTQATYGSGGFVTTRSVFLSYAVSGGNAGFTIPGFEVKTDKGMLRVPAFTAAPAARNAALENAASAKLSPASPTVWAGEVFPITYVLDVSRRTFNALETVPDWNAAPLIAEDWSKPEPGERLVNGEARLSIGYSTRAYVKNPGQLALNPVVQVVRLQTGTYSFGFMPAPRVERISVESDHPPLTVRALPAPPPAFTGAVGQFTLVSKVVPEKATVGEPVTWTLELSGSGNWPDIPGLPQREVSNDFQVVQPKAKRTPAEGKLFDVTLAEDVVLVPTKVGTYNLGPVNFSYFDPKTGTYRTVTAPRTTVAITAPAAPQFNVAPTAPAQGTDPASATAGTSADPSKIENQKPKNPPAVPAAPTGIPRDPLPGSGSAPTPLTGGTLGALLIAPFVGLLGYWFFLAVRRAQLTDPLRPRREAHARLAATIAQLRTSSPPSPQLLLSWQRDTATLWHVAHAAPPASALPNTAWSTLWAESDRALYGAAPALPTDWAARAESALAAKPVPGFNPLRLFLPRNLFPFAALLVLGLLVVSTASTARAAEPATDYAAGKFAAAEKSWRAALAQNPTDWVARHNLALALAQQDKAGEAAAHAAVAFIQHPTDPSVRWHLGLAAEKGGFVPAPLAPFLHPALPHEIALRASPAQWQRVLIATGWVAALALGALFAHGYIRTSRALATTAVAVLVLSCATAAVAVVGWRSYGPAARASAVIVHRAGVLRSIPTEADTTQKTTPLAAGSLAQAGRTLLGWTQLTFDNGQTGWVRNEEFVPVWR